MHILDTLRERARALQRLIAFPDALDVRTLRACRNLADDGAALPILVGPREGILTLADAENVSLDGIRVVDPSLAYDMDTFIAVTEERMTSKGKPADAAKAFCSTSLAYAGWMVRSGSADGAVAGSLSTTGDVLRAALGTVGLREGISVASSYFLMAWPDRTLLFTDAGVVPRPTAEQLADIAESAAQSWSSVLGTTPRIAFLSFSTKGSATDASLDHVRQGASILASRRPDLVVDGELQADAALVPDVAARKAPGSPVQGDATILVFPDLNSGNIAYKLCERLGGATAVGPIVQGLRKPYCDLSRGCSVSDIEHVAVITVLMSEQTAD